MPLTRPPLSFLNSNSTVFNDPLLVLHQGSGSADSDVGFVFNRANGLVANVALYWSEADSTFYTTFTNSGGATDANLAPTTYANLVTNVLSANTVSVPSFTTTGNITGGNLITTGTVTLDRLSLSSSQTTVPPLQLTANSLNDGVGALRIDGAQADIFLNPSTATHTTVTFAVNNDQRLAFGMDNNSDFYITRRTGGSWYDDTLVIDRDSGQVALGYNLLVSGDATVSGNLTVSGTTTTVSSTNTLVSDSLIELNSGAGSNANDLGFIFERGSTGDNAAIIWDESADTFVLGTTTATGASTGDLTITNGDLQVDTIKNREQRYTTSNMMKFNQVYTGAAAGTYFTQNEYQKIVTIVPSADSQNYQVSGRILCQTASSIQTINFIAGLRSNTLPDLDWSITYTEQHNGTAHFKPQLWVKETTTAGFIFAIQKISSGSLYGTVTVDLDIIPRSNSQLDNVTVNTTQDSEQTSIDAGYTANDMTLVQSISGSAIEFSNAYTFPTADGTADQVLTTDGSGTLSFATASGGGGDVVEDTTPQLGGDLDVNGQSIVSVSNGDINITPNGTGSVLVGATSGSGALTIDADSSTTNNRALHLTITDDDPTAATTATYIDYNISGATATGGDTNHIALRLDTDSSATGGDTTDEHRVYGIYNTVDVSGDSDAVYGLYNDMRVSHSAGTISVLYGNYTLLESDNSGGTVATATANRNLMYVNGTGSTTNAYADYNFTRLQDPSTVTNAYGSYNEVQLETNSTVSTVYGVRSIIDENGGSSTNEYLFHGEYQGAPSGTGYGVYITGESNNYFSGNVTASHFVGTATEALYADLAEKYVADAHYEPGTVMVIGGDKEVTASNSYMDPTVSGIVSTNPAFLMNKDLTAEHVVDLALTGRVPCKVHGIINRGDMIVSGNIAGVGTSCTDPKFGTVVGKALENYNSKEVGIIEVIAGRL